MWEKKILDVESPKGLLRAVFFYVGKVRCLRVGDEQCKLKTSQFTCSSNQDIYKYVENRSKNRSGGLQQLNLENKIINDPSTSRLVESRTLKK